MGDRLMENWWLCFVLAFFWHGLSPLEEKFVPVMCPLEESVKTPNFLTFFVLVAFGVPTPYKSIEVQMEVKYNTFCWLYS